MHQAAAHNSLWSHLVFHERALRAGRGAPHCGHLLAESDISAWQSRQFFTVSPLLRSNTWLERLQFGNQRVKNVAMVRAVGN